MQNTLVGLSRELVTLAEGLAPRVVAVHARGHVSSSGVHWRPNLIVTAEHTVRRDEDIKVTLPDGRTIDAVLVGRAPGTDLAALRVEGLGGPGDFRPATQLQMGQLAMVVGRSRESGPNASLGIISAVSGSWRTWRGGRLDHYVRLDATVYPASSGGAVIDMEGRVIGLATSALSRVAGLAIPVTTIDSVVNRLLEKGTVGRGYLGIGLQPIALPGDLRARLSLPNKGGIIIVSVEPSGPADKAGLLIGDVIVAFEGRAVEEIQDLQSELDVEAIGRQVRAQVIRAGALTDLTLVIGERPRRSV